MREKISMYKELLKLKEIGRKGWFKYLEKAESVADHSWGTSLLCLLIGKDLINLGEKIDTDKLVKMSIIHDIAEIRTGDLTPEEATYSKEDDEIKAFKELIPNKEITDLNSEIIEGKSKEAGLMKDIDRLEMCLQALIYEKENNKKLQEFFDYSKERIKHPYIKKLLIEIMKERL